MRFYAVFDKFDYSKAKQYTKSPYTSELPITIVSSTTAEKVSIDRFDKKPRGWLPLSSPQQVVNIQSKPIDLEAYNKAQETDVRESI